MIDMSPRIRFLTEHVGICMYDITGIVSADSGILSDIDDDGCVKTSIHQYGCMDGMINRIGQTADIDCIWFRNCYGWRFNSVCERPSGIISRTIPIGVSIGLCSIAMVYLSVDNRFTRRQ